MAGQAVRERRKAPRESLDDDSLDKYISTAKVKSGSEEQFFVLGYFKGNLECSFLSVQY